MKKIIDSNIFLVVGIVILGIGAIEFYQTTISTRLHTTSYANWNTVA